MPGYQTFPNASGSSNSMAKLAGLALPPLTGKTFLDVGCNDGFFCGYAIFDCARRVVGIDKDRAAIERARTLFPQCEFRCQDWAELPADEAYDVILCASALHYAPDQETLVHRLMALLKPGGVLVLEVGVAEGDEPRWVEVERNIDTRHFPTRPALDRLLSAYAPKHLGFSVGQLGDPLPRLVFHVRHRRPFAVLLLQDPGSGKSTLAGSLFQESRVVCGDAILEGIQAGTLDADPELCAMVREHFIPTGLHRIIGMLFAGGLWTRYLDTAISLSDGGDMVFEGYVPEHWRGLVAEYFEGRGYFTVGMDWRNASATGSEVAQRARTEAKKYQLFLAGLLGVGQPRSGTPKSGPRKSPAEAGPVCR